MKENLKELAYRHILTKIARGELAPGARLSNRRLATELGISLIPVREAISHMSSEGFVEYRPGNGAFVPKPSYEQLIEVYDLREAIECHAVAEVTESIARNSLDMLRKPLDTMSGLVGQIKAVAPAIRDPELFRQWSNSDAAFHDAFLIVAGNRRSLKIIKNLRAMSHLFGTRSSEKPVNDLLTAVSEHSQIFEAVEQGNVYGAVEAMKNHIRTGCRYLLEDFHRDHAKSIS
jgi:DNA-binding GntR family transcriptional regulator